MKTIVEIIEKSKEEIANFKVHEVTKSLQNVLSILKNEKLFLVGEENGAHYKVPYSNVFYIEVVDKKSFIYTQDKVYQSAEKLYQLEEKLLPHKFIRIGKSMLLNIEVIQSVSPTLSGRFEATLVNDERVAVSRKYVPELKSLRNEETDMRVIDYFKSVFRLSSMIFTLLVLVNLAINKQTLFEIIEYMLIVSLISGLLRFIIEDKETYSNRRIILNQLLYIGLIFLQIIIGDIWYGWNLGMIGLMQNFGIALLIYAFIKFFIYSNDKKEAAEINQLIQRKRKQNS